VVAAQLNRPLRIGLTGGIGSGKSTAAALLAQHGAVVIDTDAIARQLTAPGGLAISPIKTAFGPDFITEQGALNRPRMRELVFANSAAKQQLEAILHPLIQAEAQHQALANLQAPAVVFEVPLLVESAHWLQKVDKVLVIDCEEATQIARVTQRAGWTPEAVRAVMAQQASRQQRRACADAVICNDGISLQQLAQEVSAVWKRWLSAAAS
jgi:dephospho-CoA kinase